jgi:hypothetical protein
VGTRKRKRPGAGYLQQFWDKKDGQFEAHCCSCIQLMPFCTRLGCQLNQMAAASDGEEAASGGEAAASDGEGTEE